MTRRYNIIVRRPDSRIPTRDSTYDYGRTEAQVLADAKADNPGAVEVFVTTSNAMADQIARRIREG